MLESAGKPQLHLSALDMLSKCGEQFRRRYIEKEKIPPGVAAIVGTGVDRSVTRNLGSKIETKALLSLEEVEAIARDSVANEFDAGGVMLTAEERFAGAAAVKGEAVDKAIRLAGLHAKEMAPALSPTHVQRAWVLDLKGYPMDLAGTIDVQEAAATVRDTKTSGKTPSAEIAHQSDQLTMYALAVQVLDGQAPAKVVLDYLVDLKTPKAVTFESTRSKEDFAVMLRRIENGIRAIEAGVFVPARQTDWWCNEKWCGYAGTCPYFRGKQQIAVSGEAA